MTIPGNVPASSERDPERLSRAIRNLFEGGASSAELAAVQTAIPGAATNSVSGTAKLWTLAVLTSSNASWPVPGATAEMIVEAWGGGGSGGGQGAGGSLTERGAGGGAGAYGMKLHQGTIDSTLNVMVGAGGAAALSTNGNNGGTTSVVGTNFGTLSVPGGSGGNRGFTSGAFGGSGGTTPTGANVAIKGGDGGVQFAFTAYFGVGGDAPRGGIGGKSAPSIAGGTPGGGGSGEINGPSSGSGAGGNGMVLIRTR